MTIVIVIAVVGAAAVLASLWRRQWIDAGLAAIAALSLALLGAKLTLPGEAGTTMTIDPANPPASIDGARALKLSGDGRAPPSGMTCRRGRSSGRLRKPMCRGSSSRASLRWAACSS